MPEKLCSCHTLEFYNPYNFATWWSKPFLFDLTKFIVWNIKGIRQLRRNLNNLSRGLNLSCGSNMVGFHLKSYSMFQYFSRRSIETGFYGIWDAAQIHLIRTLVANFEQRFKVKVSWGFKSVIKNLTGGMQFSDLSNSLNSVHGMFTKIYSYNVQSYLQCMIKVL